MKKRLPALSGLQLIVPEVYSDGRGCFFESYSQRTHHHLGVNSFVQDNVSFSKKNTLRGLHFQSSPGQAKLVRCLVGEIFDVVVDIRQNSSTYLDWTSFVLSEKNFHQLFIPIGFAHGFCVLSESACVLYKVDSFYDPNTEKTIQWSDPRIGIQWPVKNPILSSRDQNGPFVEELENALDYR